MCSQLPMHFPVVLTKTNRRYICQARVKQNHGDYNNQAADIQESIEEEEKTEININNENISQVESNQASPTEEANAQRERVHGGNLGSTLEDINLSLLHTQSTAIYRSEPGCDPRRQKRTTNTCW